MSIDSVNKALKFLTSDLMEAFKLGTEHGLCAGIHDDMGKMTDECFHAYQQGYFYGSELHIKTMEGKNNV